MTIAMPSKFVFRLTVAMFSALPSIGNASDWIYIGSSGGGDLRVWIDKDTMRKSGSKAKTWSRWVYKKPNPLLEPGPARYFRAMQALEIYQCDDRTSTHLQVIKYADTEFVEQLTARTFPDDATRYEDVVPESLGEKMMKFACQGTEATRP